MAVFVAVSITTSMLIFVFGVSLFFGAWSSLGLMVWFGAIYGICAYVPGFVAASTAWFVCKKLLPKDIDHRRWLACFGLVAALLAVVAAMLTIWLANMRDISPVLMAVTIIPALGVGPLMANLVFKNE